jgi:hypothetical protein
MMVVKSLKELLNCRPDVADRFGIRIALRPAAGQ